MIGDGLLYNWKKWQLTQNRNKHKQIPNLSLFIYYLLAGLTEGEYPSVSVQVLPNFAKPNKWGMRTETEPN